MPDNDRVSIDNLTTAPDLSSSDVMPVVHEVNGVKSTFKATLTAIGTFINKILNYSADLQTTNKTVIGAINELHNGGGGGGMSSDIIADAYDDTATYNTGDYCIYNDGLYVCDEDNVTGAWDSTKWTSIQVMSSIPTNATLLPIQSGSATNTKEYIDSGLSGKEDSITYESDDYNVSTYGGVIRCKKWGRVVNIQGYGLGTVTNMSTVQAYTMATIASKYRPITQQHIIGSMNAGSYATGSAQGYRINTDGTVVTYVYNGTKIENGYFNVTFIV